MKHINADRLRAEIERLKETHERNLDKPMERGRIGHAHGCVDCCDEILDFLDTLSEEPDKSREEEISRTYHDGSVTDTEDIDHVAYGNIARHFAEWQYQKDRGEFAKIKAKTWSEGFDACKEQMMKEAVEGEAMFNPYPTICLDDCKDYDFKDGDKVRIIIVKEESK